MKRTPVSTKCFNGTDLLPSTVHILGQSSVLNWNFYFNFLGGIVNNFQKIIVPKLFHYLNIIVTYCVQLKTTTAIPVVLKALSAVYHLMMR